MKPIYCADSHDRIPLDFFRNGKAIWSGGKPYLKDCAARLSLRADPRPPAEYAEALGYAAPPKPVDAQKPQKEAVKPAAPKPVDPPKAQPAAAAKPVEAKPVAKPMEAPTALDAVPPKKVDPLLATTPAKLVVPGRNRDEAFISAGTDSRDEVKDEPAPKKASERSPAYVPTPTVLAPGEKKPTGKIETGTVPRRNVNWIKPGDKVDDSSDDQPTITGFKMPRADAPPPAAPTGRKSPQEAILAAAAKAAPPPMAETLPLDKPVDPLGKTAIKTPAVGVTPRTVNWIKPGDRIDDSSDDQATITGFKIPQPPPVSKPVGMTPLPDTLPLDLPENPVAKVPLKTPGLPPIRNVNWIKPGDHVGIDDSDDQPTITGLKLPRLYPEPAPPKAKTSPVVAKAPEPVEAPAPVVVKAPEPVPVVEVPKTPAPVEAPAPVVVKAPEPVVVKAPEPVPVVEVPKAQASVEVPAPVVVKAPEPVVVKATEPTPVVEVPKASAPVEVPAPVVAKAPEPVVVKASEPVPVVEAPKASAPVEVPAPVVVKAPEPVLGKAPETTPVAEVPKAPATIEAPAPVVVKAPEPVVVKAPEPTPVVEAPKAAPVEVPAPVVAKAPEPVVVKAPEPTPVVEASKAAPVKTPEPVVVKAPEPVVVKTPEPVPVVEVPKAPAPVEAPAPVVVKAPEPVVVKAPEPTPVVEAPKVPVKAPEPTLGVETPKAPAPVEAPKPVVAKVPEKVAAVKAPEPVPPGPPVVKVSKPTPVVNVAAKAPVKAAEAGAKKADDEEMEIAIPLQPGEPLSVEEMKRLEILEGIPEAVIKKQLYGGIVRRVFRKGDLICRQGEYASTAFYIVSGKVEAYTVTPDKAALAPLKKQDKVEHSGLIERFRFWVQGRKEGSRKSSSGKRPNVQNVSEADLPPDLRRHEMGEGELFGEMSCINFYPRSANVRAKEDCVVIELIRTVLDAVRTRKSKYKEKLDRNYRERALAEHLNTIPLFKDLDPEFIEQLRKLVELRDFEPGEVIFRQGDKTDAFYLVRRGCVKVSQTQPGGELVLTYLGQNDSFGEIGLLKGVKRTATCTALDHVELVKIEKKHFDFLIHCYDEFKTRMNTTADERLSSGKDIAQRPPSRPLGEFINHELMQAQNVLLLDLEKCTRCDECVKACVDSHDDGKSRLMREGLRFDKYLLATSCRSCMDPVCMIGCPVGSIRREATFEIIIEDWCIGCEKCAKQCPYGNITMHEFPLSKEEQEKEDEAQRKKAAAAAAKPAATAKNQMRMHMRKRRS